MDDHKEPTSSGRTEFERHLIWRINQQEKRLKWIEDNNNRRYKEIEDRDRSRLLAGIAALGALVMTLAGYIWNKQAGN